MTRNQLIKALKKNFCIQELVCPHCYAKFKEKSWQFLSTELLDTLYKLRYVIFKKPITINTWHNGGQFSQRGLRCNMCDLVKSKKSVYLSAHQMGKAIDFNVEGLTSKEVNQEVRASEYDFDYPIRLERDTNGWSHIDVYQPTNSEALLVEFKG